jgi:hypothetical protein
LELIQFMMYWHSIYRPSNGTPLTPMPMFQHPFTSNSTPTNTCDDPIPVYRSLRSTIRITHYLLSTNRTCIAP